MTKFKFSCERPGLLVSVRTAAEALTALAGGADVIDVKEPDRGPLGRADDETISAVVQAVNGRAPVTAAMGELIDLIDARKRGDSRCLAPGVSLFKIGMAGCAALADWRSRWEAGNTLLAASSSSREAQPVAVVYADWRVAQSPRPEDVLTAAIERRCPVLLIDTCSKSAGSLFDHWPAQDLERFLDRSWRQNLAVVLAGSLAGQHIGAAAQLSPDLIAVRAAACEGGRGGTVSIRRVRELKRAIAAAKSPAIMV